MVRLGRRWRLLSPAEVRQASLGVLAGLVGAFIVAPLLPAAWHLVSLFAETAGKIIVVWQLTRINVGAPGWSAGIPGEFDAREAAERHRALATAYIILVLAISWALVFSGAAKMLGLPLPAPKLAPTDWMILAVFGLPALPGIVLAWRRRRFEDAADGH